MIDNDGENAPKLRKRGRPPKVKVSSGKSENQPKPRHDGRANLSPGRKPKKFIRKDVARVLDELGFNPIYEMVEICREPDCPKKVRADLTKELLSYCAVKPRHQLESDNINALTELFSLVATDGRPLPATAVTFDGEAVVVEHDGEEDAEED